MDTECLEGKKRQALRCCLNKAPACEDSSIWRFSNTGALLCASLAVRGARSCFLSFPILSLPGPTSCCCFHQLLLLCSSCSADRWYQSVFDDLPHPTLLHAPLPNAKEMCSVLPSESERVAPLFTLPPLKISEMLGAWEEGLLGTP